MLTTHEGYTRLCAKADATFRKFDMPMSKWEDIVLGPITTTSMGTTIQWIRPKESPGYDNKTLAYNYDWLLRDITESRFFYTGTSVTKSIPDEIRISDMDIDTLLGGL